MIAATAIAPNGLRRRTDPAADPVSGAALLCRHRRSPSRGAAITGASPSLAQRTPCEEPADGIRCGVRVMAGGRALLVRRDSRQDKGISRRPLMVGGSFLDPADRHHAGSARGQAVQVPDLPGVEQWAEVHH